MSSPVFRQPRAKHPMTQHILLLPGDGVGPEVMPEAVKVLKKVEARFGLQVTLDQDLVGGASIDANGVPLTPEVLAKAKAADAVLFGAVGGPKWDTQGFDNRPELAILGLRAGLGLFANLRPATVYDPLVDASTLKPEVVRGLDIMIVRESTGGIYFGEPRGVETLADGTKRGINTEVYTTPEIERVARVAFELAKVRQGRLCSVEKANVMESGLLWRQTVAELGQRDYPEVKLSHMYADNCAMQLVRAPAQFDVIVTGNLFGDLLSDLASMLTGSLGMLPSATLGAPDAAGKRAALYEPIHGSAPDIAGQGLANPMAQILSLAMLLRYSFSREDAAAAVEAAVVKALAAGQRTRDLGGSLSTAQVGDAVAAGI